METTLELPLPHLSRGRFASIGALTDEALFDRTGIRIAFTERIGGVSEGPFASLNLGDHVNDDAACVARNRAIVAEAFDVGPDSLVVPHQVHGGAIVRVAGSSAEAVCRAKDEAETGADVDVHGTLGNPASIIAIKAREQPNRIFRDTG